MYVLHPWHGASYGDQRPAIVNALIEIPQGSRAKYEIDKETGKAAYHYEVLKFSADSKKIINNILHTIYRNMLRIKIV